MGGTHEVQSVTFSGTGDNSKALTFGLLGQEFTYTTDASQTVAEVADNVATNLNADTGLSTLVTASSDGTDTVTLTYNIDGTQADMTISGNSNVSMANNADTTTGTNGTPANDTIDGGDDSGDADTFVIAPNSFNGSNADTYQHVQLGSGNDIFNFDAIDLTVNTEGTAVTATTGAVTSSGSATNLQQANVIFVDQGNIANNAGIGYADSAAEVVALMDGTGNDVINNIESDDKFVIVTAAASDSTNDSNLWYVDDTAGSSGGTIEVGEVTLMGTADFTDPSAYHADNIA